MDALLGRASSRFVFVTVLPTLVLGAFVAALLASGAPGHKPTLAHVVTWLTALTWRESVTLLFVVVVAAVALHPVQTPLIQLLEGYWLALPGGEAAAAAATKRYEHLFSKLKADENQQVHDIGSSRRASSARYRLDWLPDHRTKLLPTSLGNALRAGEERATSRYGMEVMIVMPRLMPLLPPNQLEQLSDRRTQLDAAARLCVISLLCVVVSTGLLLPTGHWLFVPLIAFSVAWFCYRAAVAAARGYCVDMGAIMDLNHRGLWRALSLNPPPNLFAEKYHADALMAYLSGQNLTEADSRSIVWQDPSKL
jgi:hypothetical protein